MNGAERNHGLMVIADVRNGLEALFEELHRLRAENRELRAEVTRLANVNNEQCDQIHALKEAERCRTGAA